MSEKRKLKRCKLIVDGVRCNLDATHGFYDETGKRVKGAAYCEEHARQYIAAHSRWSNLTWTAEPFDPRAGSSYQSSPELEAQITGVREHAADIIGHAFHPDDDMTIELAVELVEKEGRIAELASACRALCESIKLIGIIRCFQELGGNDADPDPEYIEANWLDYIPQCQGDAYQTGTVLLHKEATDETE